MFWNASEINFGLKRNRAYAFYPKILQGLSPPIHQQRKQIYNLPPIFKSEHTIVMFKIDLANS